MKIIVLAKQVPDTWSDRIIDLETGTLNRDASDQVPDEINERALECALRYKDANPDTEIVLLSMGLESTTKTLQKLLSVGADSAVLVADSALAGSDMVQTAQVLAAAVEKVGGDLLVAGNEATDGRGGMIPAMVAEAIGWPVLPGLDEVQISTNMVSGKAPVDGGSLTLSSSLPAAISVTEKAAEPRFPNFKGILQAKKKAMETWTLQDLDVDAGPEGAQSRSVMVSAEQRPAKQAGPKVSDDGTAAGQLANFLVSNRLL